MNYRTLMTLIIGLIIFLALVGELKSAGAVSFAIACLLPAVWYSLKSDFFSIKIFTGIVFVTQVISVPSFYSAPDRYYFGDHRAFNFEVLEVLPVMMIVGLFLLTTVFFINIIEHLIGKSPQIVTVDQVGIRFKLKQNQSIFISSILIMIFSSLPVKFWMFNMGVGIVGAEPPNLPYRLSGILFYVFNYCVPFAISYLYMKTNRKSIILAIIISVYGAIIGVASSSKGVVLFCTASVIGFALLDRRRITLIVSTIITSIGVSIVIASRTFVHISDGVSTAAMTELGVIETIFEAISIIDWDLAFLVLLEIINRFESFQGLFLASQFNADEVGGSWLLLLKSMNIKWVDLNHDLMHLEFLGYTIPLGFYNIAGSVNAWMLMASNRNLLMILPFALYAGATLVFLEKMVRNVGRKYKTHSRLVQASLILSVSWFYINPGSSEFILIMVVLALLGFLPVIRLGLSRPLTTAK